MAALLLRAFRWFEDGLLAKLAAAGWPDITRRHSTLFGHLDAAGTRPAELARRIGVSRQAIHETIAELQEFGLVELIDDPDHGRAKIVVLTDRGRENVRAAYRAFGELEDELGQRIGRGRVANLRMTLERQWGPVPGVGGDG
jgi:DNA-binding MarR family transcriptional regulator